MLPSILLLAGGAALSSQQPAGAQDAGGQPPASTVAQEGPVLPETVEEILFAERQLGPDPHWYANFGYYALDPNEKTYRALGRLCALNVTTGETRVLVDDPEGTVRDPCVHYDGERILFSYRRGGTDHFNLYEISRDGSEWRQITNGPYDDIEPVYLPDGGIMFCSSRCKRWVNCWHTPVAILYRCDEDGRNLHPVSANIEHDNTPWPLPDGRVLYTRWEYVDRSQVDYHHLWTMNPDGTAQMAFFGNMNPGTLMIDAKPIPGSRDVVAVFSPGHGRREHQGAITIISPRKGPDDLASAQRISETDDFRDPYPLSPDCLLVVRGRRLEIMNRRGETRTLLTVPMDLADRGVQYHEPRPLHARPRERVLVTRTDLNQSTGRLVLADVYKGRGMEGVNRGEIKRLLVLETLPMPIHYHGGMQPISIGGTFTLERILGTVPVEEDGSAYFELPALRSFFFVALDENGESVKRMQSFLTVMPGETVGCVGCHEHRVEAPLNPAQPTLQALLDPPRQVDPVDGIPDVIDFCRDIQPILDRHCVACHGVEKRKGGILLDGDRGPIHTHSYVSLDMKRQIADGRNQPVSNRPPRSIGSSASPLMKKLNGHQGVQASPEEVLTVRCWIEAGAPFPGTYGAMGSGMIGYAVTPETGDKTSADWPSTAAAGDAITRRCAGCHNGETVPQIPHNLLHGGGPGLFSRDLAFNLTRPDQSLMLLAPLAREAGGLGACGRSPEGGGEREPANVFMGSTDADYQAILALCQEGWRYLEEATWFRMPEFRPAPSYVREMKRYGVLAADLTPDAPVDSYEADREYWRSLWWQPAARAASHESASGG